MLDRTEYKRGFYLLHRERYAMKSKERYAQNRESILSRRRELMKNETGDKRIARLKFHKEYNHAHAPIQKARMQTDSYKYNQYVFAAKRRDYEFSISFDDFTGLFHSHCVYCGKLDARGIDRADNSLGYTLENSKSCCEMCNKMKWRWDTQEFIDHAKQIAKFNKNQ